MRPISKATSRAIAEAIAKDGNLKHCQLVRQVKNDNESLRKNLRSLSIDLIVSTFFFATLFASAVATTTCLAADLLVENTDFDSYKSSRPGFTSTSDLVLDMSEIPRSREKMAARVSLERQIEKLKTADGMRVLWWNIADGKTLSDHTLENNILTLTGSDLKPDLMLFGEYSENSFTPSVQAQLLVDYPYHFVIPYNAYLIQLGIAVYSRTEIHVDQRTELQWIPADLRAGQNTSQNTSQNIGQAGDHVASQESPEVDQYRKKWFTGGDGNMFYLRPLWDLRVKFKGRDVSVVPIHLAQPWRQIRMSATNRLTAIYSIVRELFFSERNPLMVQLKNLEKWLKRNPSDGRIILGDFNTPVGFQGLMQTVGYQNLSGYLKPAVQTETTSFPAPASPLAQQYPKMQIDHAFTQGTLGSTAAEIMPLRGSDHFPLYGVFN